MIHIYFRHEALRDHQREFISDAYRTVQEGKTLLAHAPTGIGKTDAVLGAAVTYAHRENKTVFFLTPKISQHRIAVEAVNGLIQKYDLNIRAVDIIGRKHSCTDPALAELDYESFYAVCEKRRKKEMCPFYAKARGYSKTEQLMADERFKRTVGTLRIGKHASDMVALAEENGCCAYEWMVKLAHASNVVIADYFQLFNPVVRDLFYKKSNKRLEDSIIIVDEAHNLPKRVREQMSTTINSWMIQRADKELRALGFEDTGLLGPFEEWASKKMKDREEMLATEPEFTAIAEGKDKIEDLALTFWRLGDEYVERSNRKSALLKLAKFMESWKLEEEGVLRVLNKKGTAFSLSKRYMDPAPVTSFLNKAHSAILMSGTLKPLVMYRDILGLDPAKTMMESYRNPFDERNKLNIIVEGVTTRYEKRDFDNYKNMARMIDGMIDATPGGVALFFPSYNVMNSIIPLLKARNLLVQNEGMKPRETAELIKRFREVGGVLCGVQGGSLSEGVDYAQGEIKTIVLIGVPLEEMNIEVESLIEYYDTKFKRGWDYGYLYPAVIKSLQAAGRGIRKPGDRCAVVFLDERFKWKNYFPLLNNGDRFMSTDEPEKYVRRFWAGADKEN
ncbi:MAG: ATP-dependent DNA helicase [Candidatus Bilamarchaeaceae archaeon]